MEVAFGARAFASRTLTSLQITCAFEMLAARAKAAADAREHSELADELASCADDDDELARRLVVAEVRRTRVCSSRPRLTRAPRQASHASSRWLLHRLSHDDAAGWLACVDALSRVERRPPPTHTHTHTLASRR